jgi:ribosomal protein L37AE/L43A
MLDEKSGIWGCTSCDDPFETAAFFRARWRETWRMQPDYTAGNAAELLAVSESILNT